MPIARLSGRIRDAEDPRRKDRAEILYHLFLSGWDIYNGNGDQIVDLNNIQKKIIETDAFVYTPDPGLQDYFNLSSIFVGFQTLDGDLDKKSAIIVDNDQSWKSFLTLMDHLHSLGTIKQHHSDYLTIVDSIDSMITYLNDHYVEQSHIPIKEPDIICDDDPLGAGVIYSERNVLKPEHNVCVFCSASIQKEDYIKDGWNLGKALADYGYGCISGAGKTGIMGSVVAGASENGGWSGGSNVPHIIRLEGLPDGLSEFWPRGDIYTRMEVMVDRSDAFVIMPGGMGTIQELMALLLLKRQNNDLMKGKKIHIYNKLDVEAGKRFWEPIISILEKQASDMYGEIKIVDEFDDLIESIKL